MHGNTKGFISKWWSERPPLIIIICSLYIYVYIFIILNCTYSYTMRKKAVNQVRDWLGFIRIVSQRQVSSGIPVYCRGPEFVLPPVSVPTWQVQSPGWWKLLLRPHLCVHTDRRIAGHCALPDSPPEPRRLLPSKEVRRKVWNSVQIGSTNSPSVTRRYA